MGSSIIAVAVVAAIVLFVWTNTEGLRWVRGEAGLRWLTNIRKPTGPDARSQELGGEGNRDDRILQPRNLEGYAGAAVQKGGRTSVDDMESSAATHHPSAFTESSVSLHGSATVQYDVIPEISPRSFGVKIKVLPLFGRKTGPEYRKEESDEGQGMVATASYL